MRFSNREKRDLLFAGLIISLAFAILLSGGYRVFTLFNSVFLLVFIAAFLTAGSGFLLHELAHKFVAQSYGLHAEFRAFYSWLALALLFSFFGFIFAAPGAVMIRGYNLTRSKNGKISVAGPLTNIFLAVLFLILLLVFGGNGFTGTIFNYGLAINSMLAAFNMIPVMPLDGAKVLAWDKKVYAVTAIVAVGLFLVSWII